jgi:hypothetical protein
MKDNTKTTTKKAVAKQVANKACKEVAECQCQSVTAHENRMIERSVLITSLLVNLFFLVGWIVIASSSQYAQALGRVIYNM